MPSEHTLPLQTAFYLNRPTPPNAPDFIPSEPKTGICPAEL
ncbi:TPA: hypothetical protein ACFRG8_001639 [Neisseria lactamica]|nr:hypothetical protein [Neisseria lactamica]